MPRKQSTTTTTTTTTTSEPAVPTVLVEWLRATTDAASEHGAHIGDRHYQGRRGQQVQIRADDAEILVANHFVRYTGQPEQVS